MKSFFKIGLALLVAALLTFPVMAQQTADIIGKVELDNGDPLPGVVITAESNKLQGSRTAVSNENGAFVLRFLPPGQYTVTATMPGMQTQKQILALNVGGVARPTIVMKVEGTQEVLVVTAEANSVLDTTQVTSNLKEELFNNLPIRKTLENATALQPGVTTTGPRGVPVISGAMSFENNYLVNGGAINGDNLRGRPASVVIEDSIEETTVISGAVSAEYGQFVGGVINTITKQGGNEFTGSLRVSLENEDWEARTPVELESGQPHEDDISDFETITLGGPIIKDRLWFFFAGRREREEGTADVNAGSELNPAILTELGLADSGNVPGQRQIGNERPEDRFEFKLTATVAENHTFVASYLETDFEETNDTQFGVISPDSVVSSRAIPESLLTFNYRGIITPELSVELRYSERELTFERNSANAGTDRVTGSTLEDFNTQNGDNYGAHFFGANPEDRNSESWGIKASYFLNTASFGTHDVVVGISDYMDTRKADNEQSPSGYRVFPSATRFDANGNPVPIFVNGFESANSLFAGIAFYPILIPSGGSDFTTQSLYLNDSWTLNDHWRFNVGFRYDKNDAFAQDGAVVSDDDGISPRLAANYDLYGDGTHVFNASYGQYVARLSDAADGASSAGSPAILYYYYLGPQTESVEEVFQYMENTIGPNLWDVDFARTNADFVSIPGQTTVLQESLSAPFAEEIQIGYSTRFSSKGYFKVNYINRDYDDFYTGLTNLDVNAQFNNGVDIQLMVNDPGFYSREYHGIQLQGEYKVSDNLVVAGNYTWSQTYGNINGETRGAGSVLTTSVSQYPEINGFEARAPHGPLNTDVRHISRVWATYNIPLSFGNLNLTALQRYRSGQHYEATGIVPTSAAYGFPSGSDLGYNTPPSTTTYFFSDRGAFTTDDIYSTNLGVNFNVDFRRLTFFLEAEILNVFNGDGIADIGEIDTTVIVNRDNPFNVFNEAPVEGTHYTLGPNFGEGTNRLAFQTPRTFRFDVGVRF
ncbi:TonB-dependent receptor [Sulfidibacter corallicola]|uniref:TonB-dependent receptor n=1 Tax=Sulfidibacter corallicola TaxID=2818388 RepID=A0A8A4TMG8_SULCO|nr:TonB-dependent receptor [Sulfidibacter corallicola]QTD51166.1 TonB-dependent receptor [Sulfidibacter corallicola]